MPSSVRLVVVDGRQLHRAALTCLLDQSAGFSIVANTPDEQGALAALAKQSVDVVLIAAEQLEACLSDVVGKISDARGGHRILLLASYPDSELSSRALEMGAHGVVFEYQSPEMLVKAIRSLHAGETWVERRAVSRIFSKFIRQRVNRPGKLDSLTARERQVIRLLGTGLSNKNLARSLFISEATVRNHLTSIFGKLGLARRTELMVYAYQNGLAEYHPPRSALKKATGISTLEAELSRALSWPNWDFRSI